MSLRLTYKHWYAKIQHAIFLLLGIFTLDGAGVPEAFAQSGREGANPSSALTAPPASILTFEEVMRVVELNNPKLRGAESERQAAGAKLLEKRGAFDPVLNVGSEYIRYNSTSTPGKLATARHNEVSAEWLTRSGVKFFSGSRLNLGNVKSPASTTGTGGEYFAGVAVPLLRGRGINEKNALERQAELALPLADAEFGTARQDVLLGAAESYWEWVAAHKRLIINRDLLLIARERAAQVRARVESGDLPPIDAAEANQEVQRRLGGQIKAERDFQKSGLKLNLYAWSNAGEPDVAPPGENRVPVNLPAPVPLTPPEVETLTTTSLLRRPELRGLEAARRITDVDIQIARNERRPVLDLYLAPGRDFGERNVGATMKFGVAFSLPFRQRRAEGLLAQAQLKQQKIFFEQQAMQQRIVTEVTDSAAAINAAFARYTVAQQELALARDLERGERTRFALGDSTLFLVNQRERAAAEAEIKLIDVYAEYQLALASLKYATADF